MDADEFGPGRRSKHVTTEPRDWMVSAIRWRRGGEKKKKIPQSAWNGLCTLERVLGICFGVSCALFSAPQFSPLSPFPPSLTFIYFHIVSPVYCSISSIVKSNSASLFPQKSNGLVDESPRSRADVCFWMELYYSSDFSMWYQTVNCTFTVMHNWLSVSKKGRNDWNEWNKRKVNVQYISWNSPECFEEL